MQKMFLLLLLIMVVSGCHTDGAEIEPIGDSPYFPLRQIVFEETTSISSLGWNPSALQPLKDFLAQKNSKAFMILVDGRIVVEAYFNGHTASSSWEWNSAGKTLVSATVGSPHSKRGCWTFIQKHLPIWAWDGRICLC